MSYNEEDVKNNPGRKYSEDNFFTALLILCSDTKLEKEISENCTDFERRDLKYYNHTAPVD